MTVSGVPQYEQLRHRLLPLAQAFAVSTSPLVWSQLLLLVVPQWAQPAVCTGAVTMI